MKRIDENQILDEKIRLLEIKRNHDFEILRNQFNETLDSLKPVNIVKETIADFKKSKEIKSSLLETTLGIAGGYLTRKMMIGKSAGTLKKITATIVQYLVSNFITNKAEQITSKEKEDKLEPSTIQQN
ncbi:MAG: hypothetical protein CMP76_09980 [Flavobacterium sp.]|uniref:hypothetical protein n=1 Tax=unclassified Flavobacterium TaxID=196869 RepID=UPI000C414906|nr:MULTISPECIES: hypothetical protein [unclassified Flavobacterium]MBF03612.1 hypothetical protein [Flavobacterium sp.]MCO6163641.1 hypothetical protein [Flavobacterium sp. NRK F7]